MLISSPPSSRKIPTVIGLGLVVVLVGVVALTTQAVQQVTKFLPRASQTSPSIKANTANITDTSFTVYWSSGSEATGAVYYGPNSDINSGVAVDDRDLSTPNGKYTTHFVRVAGLVAQTKYYFKIKSGSSPLSGDPDNNDAPYTLTTGPTLTGAPVHDPIFGKVIDTSGNSASGVIAVWESPGAGKIAALSKNDGNYVLPIANARLADRSNYFSLSSGTIETITLDSGGAGGLSTISCTSGLDKPLPTAKLGENYDCSSKTTSTSSGQQAGFTPPGGSSTGATSGTQININNGQTVTTPLPTISGKAGPKQVVKILIESPTPYSGTVQAGPDGSWSWTPPANLSPGQHTVTITIVNADGTTQTIIRTFTVTSTSPILPLTSGTPSAQTTHYSCVNQACVQVQGTGSDTCAVDADCKPTSPATPPAAAATPPSTGAVENTLLILTLGLAFTILSAVISRVSSET